MGKAEHTAFEVPTVSLHVHERIDPRTIIEAVRRRNGNGAMVQGSLFESVEENPPLRQAVEFYQHAHGWSNRMVAGDSLLVMNSLLEKGSGCRYKTVPHVTLKSIVNNPDIVVDSGQRIVDSEEKPGSKRLATSHYPLPEAARPGPAQSPQRIVVSFGPEHAPLEQRQVAQAIDEAQTLVPRPALIVFAAFQFDPEAAKGIDETNWPGVTLLKAQMNADLLTDEELIEAYRGTVSLPFEPGKHRRIAVKIVDDRGIESLKVMGVEI